MAASKPITLSVALLALLVLVFPASAQVQPGYQLWIEPTYQAYSLELPQDWQIQGAVIDFFGAPQPNIAATSPDMTQVVFAGLNDAYLFAEPNPALSLISGDALPIGGYTLGVLPVMEPAQFAADYLTSILRGSVCAEVEFAPVPGAASTLGSAASDRIAVRCHYGEGLMATGLFASTITRISDPALGQLWFPSEFYGYLADAGHETAAEMALTHMLATFTPLAVAQGGAAPAIDPAALADQQMAQALNGQIDQMLSSHMMQSMTSSFNNFQANSELIFNIPTEYDVTRQWEWRYEWQQP